MNFGSAVGYSIVLVGNLTLFGAAAAAEPAPVKSEAQRLCTVQAEGYLNGRLGVWQQRMNLGDWKITVKALRASELRPQTLGNIHWDTKRKTATIHVMDAADYKTSCHDAVADMEVTLVHELVHLELSSLPRSASSRREEEFAVNRIAGALMGLDHHTPTLPVTAVTEPGKKGTDSKPEAARSAAP